MEICAILLLAKGCFSVHDCSFFWDNKFVVLLCQSTLLVQPSSTNLLISFHIAFENFPDIYTNVIIVYKHNKYNHELKNYLLQIFIVFYFLKNIITITFLLSLHCALLRPPG